MRVFLFVSILVLFGSYTNDNKQNQSSSSVVSDEKGREKSKGMLICPNNTINSGNLIKGVQIEQNFELINTGIEDVEIIAYQASCNCTDLKITNPIVKPKDSTIVKMLIETHDKSLGEHTVTATIKTNGKRQFYLLTTNFILTD